MPLLLFAPYARSLAALSTSWDVWVSAEERVLERARSLYLFRWFSVDALPLRNESLRIWIVNVAGLGARLAEAPGDAASLVEPAMGISGAVTGALFSPTGVMTAVLYGTRAVRSRAWVLHAFNALANGIWIGAAVAGVIAPIGVAVVLPGQLGQLDALARIAHAQKRYWTRLTGPGTPVRDVANRFAALMAMLAGAFAVAIVDFGGQLWLTAKQVEWFRPLAAHLFELAAGIVLITAESLDAQLQAIWEPFAGLFELLAALFADAGLRVGGAWRRVLGRFTRRLDTAERDMAAWWRGVEEWLLSEHPVLGVWPEVGKRLRFVADAWERSLSFDTHSIELTFGKKYWQGLPVREANRPLWRGGLKDDFDRAVEPLSLERTPLDPPDFEPPPLPRATVPWSAIARIKAPSPLAALEHASHHRGQAVFASRMQPLLAEADPVIPEAELATLHVLAERVLAPAVGNYTLQLDEVLAKLPVKKLPERPLRPQIQRLRVRVEGDDRAGARAWADSLRTALAGERYLAGAGA